MMNNPMKISKPPDEDEKAFEDSSFFQNFIDSTFIDTHKCNKSNANNSLDKSSLNVSALCCDEELSGYDKLTGKDWIYPTNYPVRDYQFNIIKAALLKNTLVSLPTGLGKTFIAAVIMYNFYRWYPLGKIVFTAPTRPLVAQQIEACYNIVAIPQRDTIEMTGHMQINTRKAQWQSKRVFFATPQVIYNDIKSGICPGEKLRCLVIDEAHKARGNYAYCQIISTLTDMGHRTYRILALSATPGSKVDDVISVVNNLHIANLELRTENCIDVVKYSHSRKINTVVIQLGPELTQLRNQYVEILDGYARRLKQFNILPQNVGNLSKGRIVMLYKEYQNGDRAARHPQHNYIMKDFTVLIALYHGLELLVKHGSRVFLNFFDEHPEKGWIQADDQLTALLERLRDDLGVNPLSLDKNVLPDGTIPEIPKNLSFGHPKFYKLKEIMVDHFTNAKQKGEDTRAIVFCEYRESVHLVHCLLLQCRPLILPQVFVGQGASGREGGVSQRAQGRAVRAFREGAVNVLVSTCVAEEGLDVGAVDLCVCFDVSTRSPIRLVQRCGRTGRARGGQVFILVTEGREHQTLLESMRQRDGLNSKILHSKEVQNNLYKLSPRMVPHDFTPQCRKMFITVKPTDATAKTRDVEKAKKGQKDLRSMLMSRPSTSACPQNNVHTHALTHALTREDFSDLTAVGYAETDLLKEPTEYWCMTAGNIKNNELSKSPKLELSAWLKWQRTLQQTVNVEHSKDSEILASLLQYSNARRSETPATQPCVPNIQNIASEKILTSPIKIKPTSKRKAKVPPVKSPSKKDGDIRALFSTATKSTKNYTKLLNDLGIQNEGALPTRLISLLVDLSLENSNITKKCHVCLNVCNCKIIQNIINVRKPKFVTLPLDKEPNLPEINLIDDFDANMITMCNKSIYIDVPDEPVNEVNDKSNDCSKNFDLQFDFDNLSASSSPKIKDDRVTEKNNNVENNFDIGDLDDIFAVSSPEDCSNQNIKEEKNSNDPKKALGFFGLDSIDDIFADSDDDDPQEPIKYTQTLNKRNDFIQIQNIGPKEDKKLNDIDKELKETKTTPPVSNPKSPSLLSGILCTKSQSPTTSPILCSQVRKFKLSTKKRLCNSTPLGNANVRRQLLNFDKSSTISAKKDDDSSKSALDSSKNKSMFTITQLVEMINGRNESCSSKTTNITCDSNPNESKKNNRSPSPILLTQRDRIKTSYPDGNKHNTISSQPLAKSLIILDSDSDSSEDTREYKIDEHNLNKDVNDSEPDKRNESHERVSKRKIDDIEITNSPYFNKKPKVSDCQSKPLTLQEKVLAALNSNKIDLDIGDNDKTVNFIMHSPILCSQKENRNPIYTNRDQDNFSEAKEKHSNPIEMLQTFKRTTNRKTSTKNLLTKQKIFFNNSDDDDFVDNDRSHGSPSAAQLDWSTRRTANYKVRKKQKTAAQFIDDEAELSEGASGASGDGLSDESVGSIVEFICDDGPAPDPDDMHAYYIKSVKSPIKGVFKIPELPNKFNMEEILSQCVENDTYEMDSFCVDSHIGLTQANDLSELEIAEKILEEKKKRRQRTNNNDADDSPLVKRKCRVKRKIESDSDESN